MMNNMTVFSFGELSSDDYLDFIGSEYGGNYGSRLREVEAMIKKLQNERSHLKSIVLALSAFDRIDRKD